MCCQGISWTWGGSWCKKDINVIFCSSRCTCKQDYLLKLRLFTKICTLLYIWVLKRRRWVRLLQEDCLQFVCFFLFCITPDYYSIRRYIGTLFKCLFAFSSSVFFISNFPFGYCKTVTNFISQFYFVKTHFESWLKDLRHAVWLCYLINQAQSWSVLWGSSTGSAGVVPSE